MSDDAAPAVLSSTSDDRSAPAPLAPDGRFSWGAVALLALLSLWIFVTRLHTLNEPFERDIITCIEFGRMMADGKRMYVDMVEFKPPGAFAAWMLIHQTIGSEPPQVFVVGVVVSVLTMLGIYSAAVALTGGSRAAGVWAAVFWALTSGERLIQGNQPNIEVFMNLFLAWGVAVLARCALDEFGGRRAKAWRYVVVGLLLSLATLQKHHLFITVVLFCCAWLAGAWAMRREHDGTVRRAIVGAAIIGATITVCWTLVIGYFAMTGRFRPFTDQLVNYAVNYSTSGGGTRAIESTSIWRNLAQPFVDTSFLMPERTTYAVPLFALAFAAIVTSMVTGAASRALGYLMIAWIVGTYLTIALPGTFFPHYYQLYLPPLAIGAAWGTLVVAQWLHHPQLHRLVGIATTLFVALLVVPEYGDSADQWSIVKYHNAFVLVRQVAALVEPLVPADETFFEIGTDPGLYYYAHRKPSSGIFWAHRTLIGPYRGVWSKKVIEDLDATQPNLIVLDLKCKPPKSHPFTKWMHDHRFIAVDHPGLAALYENLPPADRRFVFLVREGSVVWERARSMSIMPATKTIEEMARQVAPSVMPIPSNSTR